MEGVGGRSGIAGGAEGGVKEGEEEKGILVEK
jgi:hypothetical protein